MGTVVETVPNPGLVESQGVYFEYHKIQARFGLTFEQFQAMNKRGDWEHFIRAQQSDAEAKRRVYAAKARSAYVAQAKEYYLEKEEHYG